MTRRWIASFFLLTTPLSVETHAAPAQDQVDIGGLLSEAKKPCDEDKKKTDAAAQPADPALLNPNQGTPGLFNLHPTPTEKQPGEPAKKSLGALPGPMPKCK